MPSSSRGLLYRSISLGTAYRTVRDSARSTASVGILVAGALVFNYVVTVGQIPNAIRGSLAETDLGPIGFLLRINALLLLLGCFLEASTILLVIVPIFLPPAMALGGDPVHLGVIVVVNTMLLAIMILGPAIITFVPGVVLWLPRPGGGTVTDTTIEIPAEIRAGAGGQRPILVINGPNLNMLGSRQAEIHGHETQANLEQLCCEAARAQDLKGPIFECHFRPLPARGVPASLLRLQGRDRQDRGLRHRRLRLRHHTDRAAPQAAGLTP